MWNSVGRARADITPFTRRKARQSVRQQPNKKALKMSYHPTELSTFRLSFVTKTTRHAKQSSYALTATWGPTAIFRNKIKTNMFAASAQS